MKTSMKRTLKLLTILSLMALTASIALAQSTSRPGPGNSSQRALPAYLTDAKLDAPITRENVASPFKLNRGLVDATGTQRVVVRLTQPSMAERFARGERSADATAALDAIDAQQAGVLAAARALDANFKDMGRTRMALNAVFLHIDASALSALARNPNVQSINPVIDYELDLSETVPYIGASAVQALGFDGTGIKVAVNDSGIDYTHVAFGGSGDVDEFLNNDPTIIEEGTFPTAKVVGGYDFVGSNWPNTAEEPDPDPLDAGPEGGHGTHVGDIIGGITPGASGVAPGVDLYAVKVCSSVSTSCSGIAMLQGMDFALDPNGDGNMDDRVDIINMSLGSSMGDAIADDSSFAVENASAVGVLTVASAGNGGDLPYIHGTPAGAPSALAVAQTAVPSASMPVLTVKTPESIAGVYQAGYQPWSGEFSAKLEAPLQYGDGAGGQLLGCSLGEDVNSVDPADAPYPPGSLTGKIIYVDRGACSASVKINNIAYGGGMAGIIGMVAPGDPYIFAFGGGDYADDIPGFTITQADAAKLKANVAGGVTVAFDPADNISLVQSIVGSSSRGPGMGTNLSKPDIGAPGASLSAEYGTGDGTTVFGGTSGAAPMVSGAAALVMQANPGYTWAEVKAILMNTAETNIANNVTPTGSALAPITRIGGGEVRVDRAVASSAAAWDAESKSGSLSFGFHDVPDGASWSRDVVVHNYSAAEITYDTSVEYRFANDEGGEVAISLPDQVTVPAGGSTTITVEMTVEQNEEHALHPWVMNSGSQGNNPATLTFNEYDGYIRFTEAGRSDNDIHMSWHVLPRGAADMQVDEEAKTVQNAGKAEAYIDTFSLLGISSQLGQSTQPGSNLIVNDLKYFGVQTYPVPAGFCSANDSFVMAFAVNTWERQSLANPGAIFEVDLDVDGDGAVDYAVYNYPVNFPTDTRNVTNVLDVATSDATAYFFTTHNTNSANTVLTFCAEQIGMDADDLLTTSMDAQVLAVDGYYSGAVTDYIAGMNIVPLGERFFTVFGEDDAGYVELDAQSDPVDYAFDDYEDQLNATERGVLWLYGPGSPADNEARIFVLRDFMTYLPAVRR